MEKDTENKLKVAFEAGFDAANKDRENDFEAGFDAGYRLAQQVINNIQERPCTCLDVLEAYKNRESFLTN